jgi:hypothetical protein
MNPPTNHFFIQIPRTASASINFILNQEGGHRTAYDMRKKWGKEVWNDLFTFAFVRHPIDRFLSGYYHLKWHKKCHIEGEEYKNMNVNEYLKHGLEPALKDNHQMFRPQVDYVCDKDDVIVNFLGRYESLEEHWARLAPRLGTS